MGDYCGIFMYQVGNTAVRVTIKVYGRLGAVGDGRGKRGGTGGNWATGSHWRGICWLCDSANLAGGIVFVVTHVF